VWECIRQVDEVLVLPTGPDWTGVGALVSTVRTLRARRFDAAVHFSSPAYKWISFLSGIPKRTYMKFDRLWWLFPRDHGHWRARHAVKHYYDCAHELLPACPSHLHPRLDLPKNAACDAASFLADSGLQNAPVVGLHPGGAGLAGLKRWPADKFARLGDRLQLEYACRVVLLGGPDECDLAAEIAAQMTVRPCNATGALPLLTTFGVLYACSLVVGNDSSLLHAAAALGTPVVGIFGPTPVSNFRPLPAASCQARIVSPQPPCPEQVGFVGSDLVWRRPRCNKKCQALTDLCVEPVLGAAAKLLRSTQARDQRSLCAADRGPA
jgi:ADP-heptose:LPS heptosyltransferase